MKKRLGSERNRVFYWFSMGGSMFTIICPKCAGEDVKPIERWEFSEFKVVALPRPMWACKDPMFWYKWSRYWDPTETSQVIGHYLDRLED